MSSKQSDFDILIVGGGLVGASLAIMLKDSGYAVAIIEAFQHDADAQPSYDDRSVALSYGSRLILQNMGVWDELCDQIEAINTIHVSDRGHMGVTRLRHTDENVEALGYVAENRVLGAVLYPHLMQQNNVTLFCPANLRAVKESSDKVSVTIVQDDVEKTVHARCLVAADGITSKVRECLHIGSSSKDYKQNAVITNITPGQSHDNIAYERFTNTGPIAFLPLTGNRCSVVWTLPEDKVDEVMALDDKAFLQQLQHCFGYRLGKLKKTGVRHKYPLSLTESSQITRGRTVVVGNAAHAIHPVAGQGFNLALRSIATLVDCFATADDPGDTAVLTAYQQQREADTQNVYRFTDTLIKVFSNNVTLLSHARALGLLTVDVLPFIKHELAKQSMGLSGRLSVLGRW